MKIGILGGGQLGRMLALAGVPLGMRFRFLEPKDDPPAGALGDTLHLPYDDMDAVDELADGMDVVTYEFENVSVKVARHLQEHVPVHPAPEALEMAQDRMTEKDSFRALGIPTAPYRPVASLDELRAAAAELGLPAVLKTRRFGYDGKGQAMLETADDLAPAIETLPDRPLILEGFVEFDRELSIVAARGRDGSIAFYPLVENEHRDGILRATIAPAPDVPEALQKKAEGYSRTVLEKLNYVGVLAIELFQCGDELLANEMAPRVHNSGHWTQDGASCCQFENHMRAVAGLPLGSVEPLRPTTMINLIGTVPDLDRLLAMPGLHLHLYDKSERPGRKLGHVNVVGEHPETVAELRKLTGLD